MKKPKQLNLEELKSKMDTHADFILVDVLSPVDYKNAHIKGAINIPLDDLDEKGDQWLNRHIDIIVYSANMQCKGAQFAQEKLGKMGFRCWSLLGGLEAWEKAHYPLEGNPNYKPHKTTDKPKSLEDKPTEPPKTPETEAKAEAPKPHPIPGQVVGNAPAKEKPETSDKGHKKKKKAA